MDKINTHKFDLGVKNNDASKTDDVLGALFSLPVLVDEKKVNGKNINEFIVNPSIEKVLSSKKLSKNKKHVNFTSFSILNTKYNKHKINSELASDKLTIYKN